MSPSPHLWERDAYVNRKDHDPEIAMLCNLLAAGGVNPWCVLGNLEALMPVVRAIGVKLAEREVGEWETGWTADMIGRSVALTIKDVARGKS